jgi:hypothetical protein
MRNDLGLLRNLTPGVLRLVGIGAISGQSRKRQGRIAYPANVERLALAG